LRRCKSPDIGQHGGDAGAEVTGGAHWVLHASTAYVGEAAGEGVPRSTEVNMSTRGVLFVHSCPPALRPHVEWAVAGVLGVPADLDWQPQPIAPGCVRAETGWHAAAGTAGRLAAALRGWPLIRCEVTEEPSDGADGERYAMTPDLGVFRATMSANGDVLVQEDRLRTVLATSEDLPSLRHAADRLLGTSWDIELEPYRHAGDGVPVRWLSSVG
jgi:hypothetical protein